MSQFLHYFLKGRCSDAFFFQFKRSPDWFVAGAVIVVGKRLDSHLFMDWLFGSFLHEDRIF